LKKNTRPEQKETDWAYLAGIIDGEGTIRIKLHRQFYPHLNKKYERCYVELSVANTDIRLHAWLKEFFGGRINEDRSKRKHAGWSRCWHWSLSCSSAVHALERCYPYLVIKKHHAEVAFAFQKTVCRPGQHGHSPEVWQEREKLRGELHSLCQRPGEKIPRSADHVVN